MIIYIPTLNRVGKQITYDGLPDEIKRVTYFVASPAECEQLKARYPKAKLMPCELKGIGPTRQFIIDNHDTKKSGPHVCMLDDDLKFFDRRTDDPTKFEPATAESIIQMFNAVGEHLLEKPLVSVMTREGGNRKLADEWNSRCLRVLAYDTKVLKSKGIRFDRLPVMEDFDVALQLLEMGFPAYTLSAWVQDQGGSNTAGGCSTYRTKEVQSEGAKGLARLHPRYVRLVQKETKVAWGGGVRLDVQVQWKRAYNDAIS